MKTIYVKNYSSNSYTKQLSILLQVSFCFTFTYSSHDTWQLAAAYQSIKSEYAALALHNPSTTTSSTNNWQLLSSHADGSEVSLLEHPTDPSCPYVRMTSVMPGTMQDVWVSSSILFTIFLTHLCLILHLKCLNSIIIYPNGRTF